MNTKKLRSKIFLSEILIVMKHHGLIGSRYGSWEKIDLDHSVKIHYKKRKIRLRELAKQIRKETQTTSKLKRKGVYVYLDPLGKCLYVGKTINIAGRIYDHYKESLNIFGALAWRKYFTSNKYKLTIYFMEIDSTSKDIGETLRIIIERLLIFKLQPEFEKHHKTIK